MAIAGLKLYFPNIVLKLVRSNLPPHQAVFYTPPKLNKFDIKDMLQKLYDIKVLDVRTMNLLPIAKKKFQGKMRGGRPAFKKAIVTMADDFIFPSAPSVFEDSALRVPPRVAKGRNTGNHVRKEIEKQARERDGKE